MLISVIVPVFNVESYLYKCIDSLMHQNDLNIEIILVDDGSTDKSGEMCDILSERYRNISAYHKSNGGLASARNFGLNVAKGDYITFVDSDDYVSDLYFASIREKLELYDVDILKFGYQRMNGDNPGKIDVPCFPEGLYIKQQIEEELLPGIIGPLFLFDHNKVPVVSACTTIYKASFIKENELIFVSERKILNEDTLFNFEACIKAQSIYISHETLYYYCFRQGSLTRKYISNMVERKRELQDAKLDLLKKNYLLEKFEKIYFSGCLEDYYSCLTNECWNHSINTINRIRNIKEILNSDYCRNAINHCNNNCNSLKGKIIYYFIKWRAALAFYYLYRVSSQEY